MEMPEIIIRQKPSGKTHGGVSFDNATKITQSGKFPNICFQVFLSKSYTFAS